MQIDIGQTNIGQIDIGQTDIRQTYIGQIDIGQTYIGQTDIGQINIGQTDIGQTDIGQTGPCTAPSTAHVGQDGQSSMNSLVTGMTRSESNPRAFRPPVGRLATRP